MGGDDGTGVKADCRQQRAADGRDVASIDELYAADALRSRGWEASAEDARTVAQLFCDQLEFANVIVDGFEGCFGVANPLRPRNHDFPAPEHEDDDARFVEAVDESGELLGFVLDGFETEADSQRVQVERRPEVGARNDVLDGDIRVVGNRDSEFGELVEQRFDGRTHVVDAVRAGADDFARPEDETRRLGISSPIHESGEVLGVVIGPVHVERESFEVELDRNFRRSDDVLNLDGPDGVHLRHLVK